MNDHRSDGGSSYDRLVDRLRYLSDIKSCHMALNWDAETAMPEAGVAARARQVALLQHLEHATLTDPATAALIEQAERELPMLEEDAAHMIRLARYDFERATKLPASFVSEFAALTAEAPHVWARCRRDNDFPGFQPTLERIVDMVRRKAEFFAAGGHLYDGVLQEFEPTVTTAQVQTLFARKKERLLPLIRHVASAQQVDTSCLQHRFSPRNQAVVCREMALALGLDPHRARLDVTTHPATEGLSSPFDVRISTRYVSTDLMNSILGTVHETGHALYELGLDKFYAGTPLGSAGSMGPHESQSRLWENFVARSRAFWTYWYPRLQKSFPGQLGGVPMETFYRAIHKAGPSFIRTEADELTYPLHIILRFELEQEIISGSLPVNKLPQVWNDRFEEMFGIRPPNDTLGVLQDIHWSAGLFGYFPSYDLGNNAAMQLAEQVMAEHPDLPAEFEQGKYDTLREWLRVRFHRHGRRYGLNELMKRITGADLSEDAFIRHVDSKYGADIYPGFRR